MLHSTIKSPHLKRVPVRDWLPTCFNFYFANLSLPKEFLVEMWSIKIISKWGVGSESKQCGSLWTWANLKPPSVHVFIRLQCHPPPFIWQVATLKNISRIRNVRDELKNKHTIPATALKIKGLYKCLIFEIKADGIFIFNKHSIIRTL